MFPLGSTGLMLAGVLWMALVGGLWCQTYEPEGVWLPYLSDDSLTMPSAGGTACVLEVRQYGQTLWLSMNCDPLPRSAGLSPAYTGPLIELPYHLPSEATNVDCLVTTAPHSTGKIIAGTNDLSGLTNFIVGFVLPDDRAAAVAVKEIQRMILGRPHGVDSPLFVLRRTLGKDANGRVMAEEIFGALQLQERPAPPPTPPRNLSYGPMREQTLAFGTNGETEAVNLESNQMVRFPFVGNIVDIPDSVVFVDDPNDKAIFIQSIWQFSSGVRPVNRQTGASLTPAQCWELAADPMNLRGEVRISDADLPATCVFQTLQGHFGALVITRVANGQSRLDLRYQLVMDGATNAVIPIETGASAGPPTAAKPIPPEAVKLFNQIQDLEQAASGRGLKDSQPANAEAAKLWVQRAEAIQQYEALIKGTPADSIRQDVKRLARQAAQLDHQQDREQRAQLFTDMQRENALEMRLMVEAGAAELIQPGANQLRFGPWVEVTVLHPSAGKDCCLNFETGQLLTPPPAILAAMPAKSPPATTYDGAFAEERAWYPFKAAARATNAVAQWLVAAGVDAVGLAPQRLDLFCPVLFGNPTELYPARDPDWEAQLTPALVLWSLEISGRERQSQPGPGDSAEATGFPPAGEYPPSEWEVRARALGGSFPPVGANELCFFRTRTGRLGVLQILGATDNPPGVKLRYKLVRHNDSAPAAQPGPANSRSE
jgi:hypothetical protein